MCEERKEKYCVICPCEPILAHCRLSHLLVHEFEPTNMILQQIHMQATYDDSYLVITCSLALMICSSVLSLIHCNAYT